MPKLWEGPAMTRRSAKLALIGLGVLLLACSAGLVLGARPLLAFDYQWARQRWEQGGARHYEVDVTWASGWRFGHARVELRDEQFVRATDLDTGQPLALNKRADAAYFASVEQLFKILEPRMQARWYWRTQLERAWPALARRLDPCPAPLTEASYDSEFGYPNAIAYNDGWCSNTFFTYSNVKITRFRPLP
jgi:hypothetical protein